MKQLLLILALLSQLSTVKGQLNCIDTTIYNFVEVMPEFPGGNLELCRYISSNCNTPDNNWFVSHIIFSFVIEKDGTISNKEVIINDDDISLQTGNENITDCIEEWKNTSFEILKRMPIWKSGKKNNENVRVRIRIPLNLDPN